MVFDTLQNAHDLLRATLQVTQLNFELQVKAVNTKGQSNYSNEIAVTTKVDKINPPEQVTYDPSTQAIAFTVTPTCLSLVGVVEGLATMSGTAGWQVNTNPLKHYLVGLFSA